MRAGDLKGTHTQVAYTTKPDDAAFWQRLCRETGRESQPRIVRPDATTHFNLIRYELQRPTERMKKVSAWARDSV